ncbi:MAG: sigma-54-dependent Fis family transcriptional regulator [Proteobacteria bacterium]|nr:sigma-54-dependent Fis family transcriptional regulator [Pseudomonadota bacterium]
MLEKVVEVDTPVLITGPSGTGKELVARAIHFNSHRKNKNFIAINCAALNENLLESELFGHVRGSFTGAIKDKIGVFEAATGGTLLLDEVGELEQSIQAKLLRVLQEGTFLPVGSVIEKKVDVRILTATNRNLLEMVEQGKFREDLYYRLNVINIKLPSLYERKEDIMPIVDHLLDKLAEQKNIKKKAITTEAANLLQEHKWKGNIRELENEIERMLVLGKDDEILGIDLLSHQIKENEANDNEHKGTLKSAIESLEKQMIKQTLERKNGNKSHAAKELGISRSNLIAKVQHYKLE